jgi:integrase
VRLHPEQLELIETAEFWGVDVSKLKAERERYRRSLRSEATERAYQSDLKHFTEWCGSVQRPALPAAEETIELYVTAHSADLKVSTLKRRLAAIASEHRANGYPSPVGEGVRDVMFGVTRHRGSRVDCKAALTPDQLREISKAMPATNIGIRDRAIMVLGFHSGCRRSELAALELADVDFVNGHGLILRIRQSKTDQVGAGQEVGLFASQNAETCPVRTLRAWLKVRGKGAGPLFRHVHQTGAVQPKGLTGQMIALIVRAAVKLIGLDPKDYAGHSLRAGMITAAHAAGASDTAIMQRSRHRDVRTLARYIRRNSALQGGDILAAVGL